MNTFKLIASAILAGAFYLALMLISLIIWYKYDLPLDVSRELVGLMTISTVFALLYIFKHRIFVYPVIALGCAYLAMNSVLAELAFKKVELLGRFSWHPYGETAWYFNDYVHYGVPALCIVAAVLWVFSTDK